MFNRLAQLLLLCSALTCVATARTDSRWEDMSSGLNEFEVSSILGTPLIVHEARGYKQWTFDAGGLVMFHRGAVAYWGTPRGHKPAPKPRLLTVITEPIPGHEVPSVATANPAAKTPTETVRRLPVFAAPTATETTTPNVKVRVSSFDEITKS